LETGQATWSFLAT
jgi:hypothetical protein